MTRWEYFIKRVLLTIPVLFLVLSFLFVMLRMGPIDPVAARLGPEADGTDAELMRERLGLNDPLWEQYTDFVMSFLTFDFGQSWVVQAERDILDIVISSAPATIWLGFWAILLPLFIGIPLGFYAGLNPNSFGDYTASFGGILWQALPNFWLCVLALAALRRTRDGGGPFGFDWYTFGPDFTARSISITGTPDLDWISTTDLLFVPVPYVADWTALAIDTKLILPAALILGSASMAAELRIGRTAMLETINSNFVETAKAKGLTNRVIVWKHIFRNSLIPLLPVITSEAFLLIGGSVIVEQIFNINGLGRIFFQSITQGDLPMAGALLFIFTLIILFLNILQDFLYTVIDPRVGYEK
ncbi:peptide/nickel transport system permease protein [Halorubrum alkaliphilum]|uniref:Peptide/nickel transport system permease protein n=1 Tax=Halorubrum alkaliphilum TaxID=261290 RepID=A0A8T4GGF8_9EURY|nr:ABC transporter permease [Halorubrum alkaliphilum]MBP1922720.1 peptide/nickel transport system permease protein [Halorubrum alkaliphilum]